MTKAQYFDIFLSWAGWTLSSRGTVSSKRTIVLLEGENNTRSCLRDVAAYLETAGGHLDCKETSSRSLKEESLGWGGGGGGEWFVLRGVAREALTSSHKLCLAFFLVAMVACTACCVVRCSQKVFNLWQMAGKQSFVAMGTVLGEVQQGSQWEHGITWQVCRTGYKYLKQDQLRTHPNSEGLWQLGLCPWWLGGRSEALHYSSCESGVCMRGPDACVWASPAIVPAVVLRHQCRECTSSPVCVSFEETVEDDQQTAVGSKVIVCTEFERTTENNSFGNLRFSGQGKLSCLFGLSTSQNSALSQQCSSEVELSRLSLISMYCCCFQSVMRLPVLPSARICP